MQLEKDVQIPKEQIENADKENIEGSRKESLSNHIKRYLENISNKEEMVELVYSMLLFHYTTRDRKAVEMENREAL